MSETPSLKKSLKEADQLCQTAQKKGESLLGGIVALIKQSGKGIDLNHAENLCSVLDAILFTLMNDINCIAEVHGVNFKEEVSNG